MWCVCVCVVCCVCEVRSSDHPIRSAIMLTDVMVDDSQLALGSDLLGSHSDFRYLVTTIVN